MASTKFLQAVVTLSALLVAGMAIAAAERLVVHRCVGADGVPRYQDQPCRADEQAEAVRLLKPSTAPAPAAPAATDAPRADLPQPAAVAPPPPPLSSWRCEVENGEVYFRHDFCPDSIVEPVAFDDGIGGFGGHVYLRVRGMPVTRADACREIDRGARFGAERDERAQPYEKLSGRDLCR